MSTATTTLLRTATIVFALAAGTSAMAQTSSQTTSQATSASAGASSTAVTKTTPGGAAAQSAVAATAVAASKAQQPTGLTRAQVQAEFLEARKNGTLLQTEADFDVAQTRKHVVN